MNRFSRRRLKENGNGHSERNGTYMTGIGGGLVGKSPRGL